jgi:Nitroreductase family
MERRQLIIAGGSLAAVGVGAAWLGIRQMGTQSDTDEAALAIRAMLQAKPEMTDLVRYATLAPNGHNTQPWRFAITPGEITIRPDLSRRTPIVDPDDHHIFVSLGCAAENLALAAAARGYHEDRVFDDSGAGSIVFTHEPATAQGSVLFDAIPRRQSTRAEYDGRKVSASDLATLAATAKVPGVDMVIITDRPNMNRVRDLVVAGNSAQMADPAFVRELKSWLRFSPRHAIETGDGLYSVASGNPALPEWLGPRAFDMMVTADSENDRYASQLRSSSGVAVFVGERDDREHWALAGRACQRFALQATALGLKHAFINQPVEVASLRPELATLVGMAGRRPDIVMRFGHGPLLPYSQRRPVAAVLAA